MKRRLLQIRARFWHGGMQPISADGQECTGAVEAAFAPAGLRVLHAVRRQDAAASTRSVRAGQAGKAPRHTGCCTQLIGWIQSPPPNWREQLAVRSTRAPPLMPEQPARRAVWRYEVTGRTVVEVGRETPRAVVNHMHP